MAALHLAADRRKLMLSPECPEILINMRKIASEENKLEDVKAV